MKTSVVTSAVLHGLVLAAALVTIGSPESFKVDDFEAMPVDLVPVESITQMQQGDKTAKPNDKPAPKPTSKPADVADAENLGDNKIDLKTPPIPNAKPNNNESTAAPKAAEKPLPQNDPVPNEVKEIMKEDTVVDEPKEVASIPETKPEIAPTPAEAARNACRTGRAAEAGSRSAAGQRSDAGRQAAGEAARAETR
ncbi:outer membrane biosynthesis protein TonB [Rhizobium mongolense]